MEEFESRAFAQTIFSSLVDIHCDEIAKQGAEELYCLIQEFERRDDDPNEYPLHLGPEEISSAALVQERYITDDLILRRHSFVEIGDLVILDELDGEYSHRFDIIDGKIKRLASYEIGEDKPYNVINF